MNRRWLPAGGFRTAPIRSPFTFIVDGQEIIYADDITDLLGPLIYWRGLGGYEPETVAVFLEHARHARAVVDIGAYTGYFTLIACAANPDASVVAIEPIEHVAAALQRNVALNGFEHRVTVVKAGADARDGTRSFLTKSTADISHVRTPRETDDDVAEYGWTEVELPTVSVDALVAHLNVDLVKIDVEGHEASVLQGMTETIERCRPTIVLEVLPWSDGPAQSVLDQYGYRYEQIRADELVEVDDMAAASRRLITSAGHREDGRNFLCTPQPQRRSPSNRRS